MVGSTEMELDLGRPGMKALTFSHFLLSLTLHLVFPTFIWSLWRSPCKRKDAKRPSETFQDAYKPNFLGPY